MRALALTALSLLVFGCEAENAPWTPSPANGSRGAKPPAEPEDCSKPRPGCPCAVEDERVACDEVVSQVDAQVVCGSGEAMCQDGQYGECIFNGNIHVQPIGTFKTLSSTGGAEHCENNPCDPECMTFDGDPSDLGDGSSGVAAGSGGLTLPGSGGLTESQCSGGTSGTCAHTICQAGDKLANNCDATKSGEPSCVADVCAAMPSCCTTAWNAACVALVDSKCDVTCYADSGGACVACYEDGFDHDGDGYTGKNGDCLDCDTLSNAGAYDFPGNGLDEDCDGTADNEVLECDDKLSMTSTDPMHHAMALDLCRNTSANQQGKNKTWGVIDGKLTQATGTSLPDNRAHAILTSFGPSNLPKKGSQMVVYSSGTARVPGQTGYVNPNGQYGSYNANQSVNYPAGFPKNASGCPVSGNKAYDSAGLRLKIRVPTNAKSFSYNFNYFSSEYPEWVCTAYNDHFVALLTGSTALPANPASNSNNISFDANNNPVSVNIALFTEPGSATGSSAVLTGTGFDGKCGNNQTCGGATGWLYTSAPVKGGEEITIQFSVWDQGDHLWDSTVLIDNFRWSVEPSNIVTGKQPPTQSQTTYSEGTFVRDYDASGICPSGKTLRWGHWSWEASTPSDSNIAFSVRTASSLAGLATAKELDLKFTSPPGPSALVGQPAVAEAGSPDTQHGSAVVDSTLKDGGEPRYQKFLRISSRLVPSADKLHAPTLEDWNLQLTCVDDE